MSKAAHMSPDLPSQAKPSLELESRQGLEQAFSLFNQMSSQLADSYGMLETRVAELKLSLIHI